MECSSLSAKLFREECSAGIREENRDPPPRYPIAVVLLFIRRVEGGITWEGAAQRLKELSQLPHGAGSLLCWGWKLSSPYHSGLGALTSPPRSHLPVSNTHSSTSFSSSPRSGRQPPTGVAFGPAEGVWSCEQ